MAINHDPEFDAKAMRIPTAELPFHRLSLSACACATSLPNARVCQRSMRQATSVTPRRRRKRKRDHAAKRPTSRYNGCEQFL
jgi:hypothetical protein